MASYYTGTGGNDTTGDGTTHATRWLTIQHALNNMTRGQFNRLNCTGSETLSASLDFTTYGSPASDDQPLFIQGYTSVEGDGGVYEINGGGNAIINDTSLDFLGLQRLKITNWGSTYAFALDNNNTFIECEFDGGGSSRQFIDNDSDLKIVRCKLHNVEYSGTSYLIFATTIQMFYTILQVKITGAASLVLVGANSNIQGNIFNVDSTALEYGLRGNGDDYVISNNTYYNKSAGIESAIYQPSNNERTRVFNNIIEGVSGPGGIGIDQPSAGYSSAIIGPNGFYNNTTNQSLNGFALMDNTASDVAFTASPFASVGNVDPDDDDFTVGTEAKAAGLGAGYSSAANTSFADLGALQREEAVGGSASGVRNPLVGPIG
jgi:hypothetical protein